MICRKMTYTTTRMRWALALFAIAVDVVHADTVSLTPVEDGFILAAACTQA